MLNLANPGTEVDEPGNDDGIRNVAKEPTNNWYNKEGQFGISVLVADSLHGRHGYRHSPCTKSRMANSDDGGIVVLTASIEVDNIAVDKDHDHLGKEHDNHRASKTSKLPQLHGDDGQGNE